ncbi:hypothetical protein CEXT_588061 [Caerostris extrusa]|uniref:Uncharacterized protein n=1 Tax=Caerostris extrusa TaxID=172846 RepID=A0AAV4XH26_CAEEX|nr:hypothetical protein CEXT_588061 [Caerostris extrusa]
MFANDFYRNIFEKFFADDKAACGLKLNPQTTTQLARQMSLRGDKSTSTPSLSYAERWHLCQKKKKKGKKERELFSFLILLSIQKTQEEEKEKKCVCMPSATQTVGKERSLKKRFKWYVRRKQEVLVEHGWS